MGKTGTVSRGAPRALASPRPCSTGAAALLAALLAALGPAPARAETTFAVIPRLAVGATNNATGTSVAGLRAWDGFTTLSANAQLRHEGARSTEGLGYRILYTRFFTQSAADTLTNELSWVSQLHLTATLQLSLDADAALSSTSQVVATADLGTVMPQAVVGGSSQFFRTGAGEGLVYQPKPTFTLRQTLRFTRVDFFDNPGAPTTSALAGIVGADWLRGLNTISVEGQATGSSTTATATAAPPGILTGEFLFAGVDGGWRREISPVWSAALQAGAAILLRQGASSAFVPIGLASLDYRRLPWFATLTLSQQAATNVFVGGVTINDQALVHLTLPLDKRELALVTGYGGYTHARALSALGDVTAAFDQWAAAVSFTAQHPRLPIWTSVEYLLVDQVGLSTAAGPAPDLLRHTVLVSIGGTFMWGPGTPPLLHGGVI